MEKEQDKELGKVSEIPPFVLRRSGRTARPSTWLQESLKYLNRPISNNVENENWIPRIFREVIRWLDL